MFIFRAGKLAKCTTSLSHNCKTISSTLDEISVNDKQIFVNYAKSITGSTIGLVTSIKKLAASQTQETRDECSKACQDLIENVEKLCVFVDSPQFSGSQHSLPPSKMILIQQLISVSKNLVGLVIHTFEEIKGQCLKFNKSLLPLIESEITSIQTILQELSERVKDSAPGRIECKSAIQEVFNTIKTNINDETTTDPMLPVNVARRMSLVIH